MSLDLSRQVVDIFSTYSYNQRKKREGDLMKEEPQKRKAATGAKKAHKDFLWAIFENSSDAVFTANRKGGLTRANARFYQITAYLPTQIGELTLRHLFPGTDLFHEAQLAEKKQPGEFRNINCRLQDKTGAILGASVDTFLLTDGSLLGMIRQADILPEIRHKLTVLQTFANQAPLAVFRLNREAQIIEVNAEASRSLGYSPEELSQMTVFDIDPFFTREQWVEHHQILAAKGMRVLESFHRRKDGVIFPIEVTANYYQICGDEYLYSFVQDVTQRKQDEEALRQSQQRFRTLTEAAFEGIAITRGGAFHDLNDQLAKILGYKREELLNKPVLDYLAPEQRQRVEEILASGSPGPHEFLALDKNGAQLPVEVRFHTSSVDGEPVHIITVLDIAESQRAELALRESERLLRLQADNMADVIILTDAQANVIYTSPSVERVFGYPPSELLGTPSSGWIHPDDLPRLVEIAAQARKTKASVIRSEYRWRHANGDYLWIESTIRLLYDQDDHSAGAVFSSRDVSERKRLENLVSAVNNAAISFQTARSWEEICARAAEHLRQIGLSCAFFTIDEQRRHLIPIYIGSQGETLTAAEQQTGLHLTSIMIPIEPVNAFRQTVWEGQPNYFDNITDITQQMLPRPVAMLASLVVRHLGLKKSINAPLVVENDVIGLFSVQSDDLRPSDVPLMTAFAQQIAAAWRQSQRWEQVQVEMAAGKKAEAQLMRLNQELDQCIIERTSQLEAAIQELEAFSYSVSQDMRIPLQTIKEHIQSLVDDDQKQMDVESRRICAEVLDETKRMSQLIDDLLVFSHVGRVEMLSVLVDMRVMAQAVYRELAKSENSTRIEITIDDLPPAVGDPKLIRQVWINLLSNALKFTSKRERAVIAIGSLPAENESVYFIRDNGAGFDAAYARKLFGIFERLHVDSGFPGTGIGLAIVQRVINRHGGRVWAEGEPGQGAAFFFALPKKRPA